MSVSAPTVTGWSNFWGNTANAYTMQNSRTHHERAMSRILGKPGYRGMRKVFSLMLGTAVGSTATDTYSRITAPAGLTQSSSFGGSRTIETVTSVSRATVAADQTHFTNQVFNAIFNMAPAISSYPTDASGNGGGGKANQH